MFKTKPRQLTPRTTVVDVLMDDKIIATCSNHTAASAVCVTFEQHKVTSINAFKALPNKIRNAFIAVTNMAYPSF